MTKIDNQRPIVFLGIHSTYNIMQSNQARNDNKYIVCGRVMTFIFLISHVKD